MSVAVIEEKEWEATHPAPDFATARCWLEGCCAGQDEVKAMATILQFSPGCAAGATTRKQSRSGDAASCEIVIFPGIRVERDDFDLAARLPRPKGGGGPRHETGGK